MKKSKSGGRMRFIVILFTAVIIVYGVVLTNAVVLDSDEYDDAGDTSSTYEVVVEAARGEIYDRNGVVLVSNRQGNSIEFNAAFFPSQSKQSERNAIISALIELCESKGEEWTDNLPIIYDEDGSIAFAENRETDIKNLKASNMLNLNSYATAENCLDALIEMYSLEDYDEVMARKIASVLYEMWRTGFSVSTPYTFAEDVSNETISIIKEKSDFFQGVEGTVNTYREFTDGTLAPHIIGITGIISSDEYTSRTSELQDSIDSGNYSEDEIAELELNAYSLTDYVGKFGIESAMESYLRGTKGIESITVDSDGNVTSEYTVVPEQGASVVLTIDSGLQRVAQNALETRINELTASAGLEAAGAVVVLDVDTGEVLASASYPSYDLSEYYENYNTLLEDEATPLVNRVLQSTYEPGSTMKLSTALAGLDTGAITSSTTFYCSSVFQYYDTTFSCLSAHGTLNVISALEKSCNIFFYNVAQTVGIDVMNSYSTMLGLGQKTGVELSEAAGILAGRAYRESIGSTWQMGDTIQAAIGQSDNLFTILQLANYCATIANNGTRYKCHYVKYIMSADHSEILYEAEPEVLEQVDISQDAINIVKQGMLAVTTTGSCAAAFADISEKVGAKTGTTQVKKVVNGKTVEGNNGLNISFAPYDDPEIAIAVIIENLDSGTATANVSADIYEYYFSTKNQISSVQSADELLR
ncbi:MAG: hypothetical protein LUH40_06755 [Clostridiales bacterium]|nr:hypothetical protein [Clostridiales bacterium]